VASQNDDVSLKGQLLSRQLPPKDCLYRSVGSASGQLCVLCDLPIIQPEVEFALEWETAGQLRRCRFHLVCYHLWQDS
jgi:hypothetical protein